MKPIEAYKWIYTHYAPCGDETKQDDAITTALSALKKQVPMKPEEDFEPIQKHMNIGVKAPYCPICRADLLDEENNCYEYCPHCGQKIEWSED